MVSRAVLVSVFLASALFIVAQFSGLLAIPISNYGIKDNFDAGISDDWIVDNVEEVDGVIMFPRLGANADAFNNQKLKKEVSGSLTSDFVIGSDEYEFVVESRRLQVLSVPCTEPKLTVTAGTCSASATAASSTLFNVFVSSLDENKAVLTVGGAREGCEFDPTSAKLSFESLDSNVACEVEYSLDEVRFRKRFQTKVDPETEVIYIKTFVGPRTVGLEDFTVPVKSFSAANPVSVASTFEQGLDSTAEPLLVWSKAGTVDIPFGEVWTVTYIGDRKFSQGKECIQGFDTDTDDCVAAIQVVQECSEDQLVDPLSGDCISTIMFACDRINGDFNVVTEECTVQGEVLSKPLNIVLIVAASIAGLSLILLFSRRR